MSQRKPDGSTSIRKRSTFGSSQVGDQSQRKKMHPRSTATGRKKTRIGRLVRSPTANATPAKKTIVGSPKTIAGLR